MFSDYKNNNYKNNKDNNDYIVIVIIIIIIKKNNNNNNTNNNNDDIGGDSSVGRLVCVFLVERFAVRISTLAFCADAPYMCGSQKRSGKIMVGVP